MRLGCRRFKLPVIRRERFRLYKRAKTIMALNLPVTVEHVNVDRFRLALLRLGAVHVDVAAILVLHCEELFQGVDSTVLLLARGAWGCSGAAAGLLVGALSCRVAWFVALEAQTLRLRQQGLVALTSRVTFDATIAALLLPVLVREEASRRPAPIGLFLGALEGSSLLDHSKEVIPGHVVGVEVLLFLFFLIIS